MNRQGRNQVILTIAILNCIQFLLLTTTAMFFYPGGTFMDPNTISYSIWKNLFSDLGQYIAHSGESNFISFIMYNLSLFLMGALYIPYFIVFPSLLSKDQGGRGFCIAGSIFGIIISVCMVGASLTPADLIYTVHVVFGLIKFLSLVPLAIIFTIAIFKNKLYPNRYAFIYLAFGIIQFIFIFIMASGFTEQEVSGIFAAGQNIVVYAMTITFLIQAYGAWKFNKL